MMPSGAVAARVVRRWGAEAPYRLARVRIWRMAHAREAGPLWGVSRVAVVARVRAIRAVAVAADEFARRAACGLERGA